MANVRVALWGLGEMGGGCGKLLAGKKGVDIVAAIAHRPDKVGKDVGEVLGLGRKLGCIVSSDSDPAAAWRGKNVDVLLHSTCSSTKDAFPQIKLAIQDGLNVICSAEEMSYPQAQEPELAKQIDALAKANNVSVLGTGINPGFVLDALIIMMTGVSYDVEYIEAARINDLSPFGPTVLTGQGVGTTVEQFKKGVADGSIVGHIGFPESLHMIANAIGWKLDKIEQSREPIVTEVERSTPHITVAPGMVAGCKQIGIGYMNGKEVIKMTHPQQICPELAGVKTGDYIDIKGTPEIHVAHNPEIPGGIGTIAMMVNMIPQVINAEPGLVTMDMLPLPAVILGDMGARITAK